MCLYDAVRPSISTNFNTFSHVTQVKSFVVLPVKALQLNLFSWSVNIDGGVSNAVVWFIYTLISGLQFSQFAIAEESLNKVLIKPGLKTSCASLGSAKIHGNI